jgi:hypothetical protein
MSSTNISIAWTANPPVTLSVSCNRSMKSNELHTLAETVAAIEEFRATVQGLEEVVEP